MLVWRAFLPPYLIRSFFFIMESSKVYLQAKEFSILLFFGGAGVIRRKLTLESLGLDIKDTVYELTHAIRVWRGV